MKFLTIKMKTFWGVLATVFLTSSVVSAALPTDYQQTFNALAQRIDGGQLTPLEMVQSGWQAARYFSTGVEGLPFNRDRFECARTPGSAGLSGLFLAVNGSSVYHQYICKLLETDRSKRMLMFRLFGTEAAFFQSLRNGEQMRPLMNALPSTNGIRSLLRRLIRSKDALTRRAGLFWGHWFSDAEYWKSTRSMAAKDPNSINRSCAQRLIKAAQSR